MTDREYLRNLCRRRLGDDSSPYHWSDLQVNQWIVDAVAEHSIHFPRVLDTTINCSDDVKSYDLPTNFIAPKSIEYPSGEDPPEYLIRKSYTLYGSVDREGFYDIVYRDDENDQDQLVLSEKPATGEDISVYYTARHDFLDDDTDVVTVKDLHLELLVLFVRWTAYQELATTESADPDPTSLSMGTLELNAFRANRAYRIKLKAWQIAESRSETTVWQMDKHDRVY